MIIHIKDMVCIRCKMAVEAVLQNLQIKYLHVELGKATLVAPLTSSQAAQLAAELQHYHLELLSNKKIILCNQIKSIIIQQFELNAKEVLLKFSEYLSSQLNYDYTYLANIFSETEGTTIERFYISYRIERVKALMLYETMPIKEISYQLRFSSVSHLSQQFKRVTGITPAAFRKLCEKDDYQWRASE